jgi:hypothetical protein
MSCDDDDLNLTMKQKSLMKSPQKKFKQNLTKKLKLSKKFAKQMKKQRMSQKKVQLIQAFAKLLNNIIHHHQSYICL